MKNELAEKMDQVFLPKVLQVKLHPDKFEQQIMKNLRLALMTSKTLIDNGGSKFALNHDFSKPLDEMNERMAYDFLI